MNTINPAEANGQPAAIIEPALDERGRRVGEAKLRLLQRLALVQAKGLRDWRRDDLYRQLR